MSDKTLNKYAVKYFITATKVIPVLIAFVHFINTILCYFGIVIPLNYLGGISFFPILYLYFASYVFKLCEYHRMFLHYSICINVINLYDYYIGIPLAINNLMFLYVILTILTLFIIIYLKFFNKKK